jgi:hypothetical protein
MRLADRSLNTNSGEGVRAGARSIKATWNAAWGAIGVSRSAGNLSTSGITAFRFSVFNAASTAKNMCFFTQNAAGTQSTRVNFTVPAGQWIDRNITLAQLGNPTQFSTAFVLDQSNSAYTVYVDDIRYVGGSDGLRVAPPQPVSNTSRLPAMPAYPLPYKFSPVRSFDVNFSKCDLIGRQTKSTSVDVLS